MKVTIIEKHFLLILTNLNWRKKVLKFTDLISLFRNESFTPEHIFLLLYKSKYIDSFQPTIDTISHNLQSGISTSFNNIRFTVVPEKAEELLNRVTIPTQKKSITVNNQLNLFT